MVVFQQGKDIDIVTAGTTISFAEQMDSAGYVIDYAGYKVDEDGDETIVPCSVDYTTRTVNGFIVVPVEDCKFRYIALVEGAYNYY